MLLTNLSPHMDAKPWHVRLWNPGTSFSLVKRVSPDIADITASMPADRASRTWYESSWRALEGHAQLNDWSARVFADCVVLWCWRGFTLHVHYVLQRNNKLTIAKRIQTSMCLDCSFPACTHKTKPPLPKFQLQVCFHNEPRHPQPFATQICRHIPSESKSQTPLGCVQWANWKWP
jgi:hypothetical protein